MLVDIWVTTACNMKCKYCYEGIEKENLYLTKSTAEQAIKYILSHLEQINPDYLIISFHGGEPLLNFDIIKYLHVTLRNLLANLSIPLHFWITTNLLILNEEIKYFLVNNIDNLSISIDGTPFFHDANRIKQNGEGTYDLVSKNAIQLLKERKDIRARMTINKSNYKGLYENVIHLYDFGFREIIPVIDIYESKWTKTNFSVIQEQIERLTEFLVEKENSNIPLNLGLIKNMGMKLKNSPCDGGITSISIDPLGYIYPCKQSVNHKQFIIGDIYSGIDASQIEKLIELDKIPNTRCSKCSRYHYCIGTRCKIINKIYTDDYNTPSANICAEHRLLVDAYAYYKKLKQQEKL